ncbi:hypothetical protein SAMN05421773_110215 [Streptomyces aidingensis]|uniref:Deoxyxylulose-5-phosphate synthase n=1 Tax=Streptomyces aidingensis TaxID=910347 RepID=A0A1I1Q1M1_9ACTN|nr:hypothetical protein SAMN05421773_110215 [Streptomyces aidingensis]
MCLPCRVSFKKRAEAGHQGVCPGCGGGLIDAGQDLAVPGKRDTAGWKALAAVLGSGLTFHSGCCEGPGWRPRHPREVRERLAAAARSGVPVAEALSTPDLDELTRQAPGKS